MSPLESPHRRPKILVVRYRFIGDTLLTVPFLRNLRAAYPEGEIHLLAAPQSAALLAHCPYLDAIKILDTSQKHRYETPDTAQEKRLTSFWSAVQDLRQEGYTHAFVLKRSFSSAAMVALAGIPIRVGFNTEGRGFLLTHRVPYVMDRHEVECMLDLLRAVNLHVGNTGLEAWWPEVVSTQMATAMAPYGGAHNIVFHLTSSNRAKTWPLERFSQLAQRFTQQFPEKQIWFHCLGAPSDTPDIEAFRSHLPEALKSRVISWAGKTNLLESMALLTHMDQVVGVDSGTLHMAAAVGVPVTALFGPMSEIKWGPWHAFSRPNDSQATGHRVVTHDLPCRPCHLKRPCTHNLACMAEMTVDEVWAGASNPSLQENTPCPS